MNNNPQRKANSSPTDAESVAGKRGSENGTVQTDADASTAVESKDAANAGYGSVAKRVTGWTNNLLATAIIILIGLTVGLGAIRMWGGGGTVESAAESDESASSTRLFRDDEWVTIQWQRQSIERKEYQGRLEQAVDHLAAHALDVASTAQLDQLANPTPVEHRFIGLIGSQPAHSQLEDGTTCYFLDGPLPMVVSVVSIGPGGERATNEPSDSDNRRRVVSWGLAMPSQLGMTPDRSPNATDVDTGQPGSGQPGNVDPRWTLFVFRSSGPAWASVDVELHLPGGITLPPASAETLAVTPSLFAPGSSGDDRHVVDTDAGRLDQPMGDTDGPGRPNHRIVGFMSSSGVVDCQRHFERQLTEHSWSKDPWRELGHGLGRTARHAEFGRIEIQIDGSRSDQVMGLIILAPPQRIRE